MIRPENHSDIIQIRSVVRSAFDAEAEVQLVDSLRMRDANFLSLVYEEEGVLLGHLSFSTMTAEDRSEVEIRGLAPVSVLPERQREGIGSRLIEYGIESCRTSSIALLAVLGDPNFYNRFGFVSANTAEMRCVYEVDPASFMVLELAEGALNRCSGMLHYHPAFQDLDGES